MVRYGREELLLLTKGWSDGDWVVGVGVVAYGKEGNGMVLVLVCWGARKVVTSVSLRWERGRRVRDGARGRG